MSAVSKNVIAIALLALLLVSIAGYFVFTQLPKPPSEVSEVHIEVQPDPVDTLNEEKIRIERGLLPKDVVFIDMATMASATQQSYEDSNQQNNEQEHESDELLGTVVASEVVQFNESATNILPVEANAYITDGAIALVSPITVRGVSTTDSKTQETTEVRVDYIDLALGLIVGFSKERNETVKIWSKDAAIFINSEMATLTHIALDDILMVEGAAYLDSNEMSATNITVVGTLEFLPMPQRSVSSELPS